MSQIINNERERVLTLEGHYEMMPIIAHNLVLSKTRRAKDKMRKSNLYVVFLPKEKPLLLKLHLFSVTAYFAIIRYITICCGYSTSTFLNT